MGEILERNACSLSLDWVEQSMWRRKESTRRPTNRKRVHKYEWKGQKALGRWELSFFGILSNSLFQLYLQATNYFSSLALSLSLTLSFFSFFSFFHGHESSWSRWLSSAMVWWWALDTMICNLFLLTQVPRVTFNLTWTTLNLIDS